MFGDGLAAEAQKRSGWSRSSDSSGGPTAMAKPRLNPSSMNKKINKEGEPIKLATRAVN